ncbi:uncharacterized protein LDX57_008651 [Aspergillus melleus]|uniref:uncharacterized protein n=1 Tax=Aspergillus melleus TaxID=138277 RepID=UPI001E8C9ED1|nr:uncharacterized protein LDX57_008651 [Aspergillus melleus]KAH8430989.1 hypothetical protein LDX57_008651 [Aspergillus melleus]
MEPFSLASDSGPRPSVSFWAPLRSLGSPGTSNGGTTEEQCTESSHKTTHIEIVTPGDTAKRSLRNDYSSLNTSRAEVEYFVPTGTVVLNPEQTTKDGRPSGGNQSILACPNDTQKGSKSDADVQGTCETDGVASAQPADPHYQLHSSGLKGPAVAPESAGAGPSDADVTGARPDGRGIQPTFHDHPCQTFMLPVHHELEPLPASISPAQASAPVRRSRNVSVSPQPFPLADDEQTLQDFYMRMGAENACGDRLWRMVKQFANSPSHISGGQQLGLRRAAELLQLAIGIASPQALIMLKECLRELRSESPLLEGHAETAGGVFRALQAFSKESHVSKVGLRLAQWRLYRMKKHSESFSEEIIRSIPPGKAVPTSAEIQRVLATHKKGVYWDNLVEAAGHQSPNILCLLPPAVIGPPPWRRKFTATTYRDMPIAEKAILGKLLWSLKRQIFLCVDRDLPNVLLRMRPPVGLYPLEGTSDEFLLRNGSSLSFDPNMLSETSRA